MERTKEQRRQGHQVNFRVPTQLKRRLIQMARRRDTTVKALLTQLIEKEWSRSKKQWPTSR